MNDTAPGQSIEDILASIKSVIRADVDAVQRVPDEPEPRPEAVLELGSAPTDPPEALLSNATEEASKAALAALSGLSIDPRADERTLDGLVREMLRPMLKSWLDDNLPEIVERVVAREVARIVGR